MVHADTADQCALTFEPGDVGQKIGGGDVDGGEVRCCGCAVAECTRHHFIVDSGGLCQGVQLGPFGDLSVGIPIDLVHAGASTRRTGAETRFHGKGVGSQPV